SAWTIPQRATGSCRFRQPTCCARARTLLWWSVDSSRPECRRSEMIALHVLQADHGDCLLLEYGCERQPRYVLIDGGPSARIYDAYMKPALLKIREQGGKLDLVVLSHVDNDHVIGLLNYFTELRLTP